MRLRLAGSLFLTSFFVAAAAFAQPTPQPAPQPGAPGSVAPPPGSPMPGQPTPPNAGPPSMGQPPPPNAGQPFPPNAGSPDAGPPPQGQGFPPNAGQPPQGQGFPPPAQPWQSAPPQGQEPPHPTDAPDHPGVSHGVPLAWRGQIAVEAAGFTDTSGQDSLVAIGLNVHIPIVKATFLDARLPMANYFPGNIMLGADHVFRIGKSTFLDIGGQLGLPLVTKSPIRAFSLPNGTWNMHEYQANFMPIKAAVGLHHFIGQSFTLRAELEPVVSIPIGDHGNDTGFTLQHAIEAQYGHSIGVGLRVQGVAYTGSLISDAYQLSVEPFLVVQRELGFARLGLLLPIDDSTAGPAFEQAWGLRLWAGLHID